MMILVSIIDVRLVDGISCLSGRVEVKYNEQWGTICNTGFGQDEAKVLCNMLGLG